MWLPLLGLLIGFLVGLQFSFTVPAELSRYTAVGILAALDAVFGAIRAELNGSYDNKVFLSGLLFNSLLAAALVFVGDRLGVDLFIAAVVAFGVRLFNNLAIIRRHFI